MVVLRFPEPMTGSGSREARMRQLVGNLWPALADQGVSWIGFYVAPGVAFLDERGMEHVGGAGEMLLAARAPKPACSPIGLEGMCGRSYRERRAVVVGDVLDLPPGVGYVACDPRDRSEVVVPCSDALGTCWGVLDLDSLEPQAFSVEDAEALHAQLLAAGLTAGDPPKVSIL